MIYYLISYVLAVFLHQQKVSVIKFKQILNEERLNHHISIRGN